MTFNLSEQQEKKYLQQVIGIINDTIQNTDTSVKEHVETLQEYKDYIWSNKDIYPSEIGDIQYFAQPPAFVNYAFTQCEMIEDAFAHGSDFMRIDIFV